MAKSEARPVVSAEMLEDLGFDQVRERLAGHCLGETARGRALALEPSTDRKKISGGLDTAEEYRQILSERWAFPRLEYEEIGGEVKRLKISGAALDESGCMRVLVATRLVGSLLKRLGSTDRYKQLSALTEGTVYAPEVTAAIESVFDKEGKIRDDASEELASLRGRIQPLRRALQKKFEQALRACQKKGLLDTTLEGFVNGRRVLAVRSSYKRQVEGTPWGNSKTGSVTFIEPAGCRPLFHELEMLISDERGEIVRILQALTARLRKHVVQIRRYNKLLIELDSVRARARLALEMKATRPRLVEALRMEWTAAIHPLLLLANASRGVQTVAQDLSLNADQRMLVISGPNAGGKSIALKMVGLLQVMVQSGLLVPADGDSCTGIFSELLVDIGDHQSIENQLSTYSSRLQRMRGFLEVAGPKSLLLLDEFGTGSDPELGGALAEVFFEALHDRGAFAVITTHYGNIKERAASLESAANGCMRFDTDTLEPLYRLDIGQPGSSFTFEVASMNGIPKALISRAKGKLDVRKLAQLDWHTATWFELEPIPVPFVAARENAYVARWTALPGGGVEIIRSSLPEVLAPELGRGRVRGRAFVVMRLLPAANGGTLMTMAMELDLGGSLPGSLVNRFLADQAKLFNKLADFAATEPGQYNGPPKSTTSSTTPPRSAPH